MNVLATTKVPITADLLQAARQHFAQGQPVLLLSEDGDTDVEMALVDAKLVKDLLARAVVDRWLADPEDIDALSNRLAEPSQDW